MSQNIQQIFVANPATSMASTDLLYLGRSPYNTADDFAITFANFAASIQLLVGLTPVSVAATTQTASANHTYILNNAAATTVTLPASGASTIGDTIKIKGRSSAPFIIQAAASQVIVDGSTSSSTAGTATSNAGTDSIQIVYVAANTWSVDWQLSLGFTLA